jgi:DNA-binding NarL/FixJ family response regulator
VEKIRVLIAAGEPVFIEGLRWILMQQEDIQIVGMCNNGEETVDMAHRLAPDVGVIELRLPGLNSVPLIKEVKVASPTTGVLALTRKPSIPCILEALEVGLAGYLLTNASPTEIILAIRGIFNGEAVVDLNMLKALNNQQVSLFRDGLRQNNKWMTYRELKVLKLAGKGLTTKEIAQNVALSQRTVQEHLANIFRKFEVGSRTEAVLCALRAGWLNAEDL